MNDDDLEQRFARLQPTGLPGHLLRRLEAAEPVSATRSRWWSWLTLRDKRPAPWALACGGLAAVWMLIVALHLATPSAPAPVAYAPVAPVLADPPTSLLATDAPPASRLPFFATNRLPASASLQP